MSTLPTRTRVVRVPADKSARNATYAGFPTTGGFPPERCAAPRKAPLTQAARRAAVAASLLEVGASIARARLSFDDA